MLYSPPIRGAIMKMARAGVLLLPLLVAGSRSALAQVDFSGEWAPRFHEDQPERVPGPPLGDYLGLPINDAARRRQLGCVNDDLARMAVPSALGRLHLARTVAADDKKRREPADARDRGVPRGMAALDRQSGVPRWS